MRNVSGFVRGFTYHAYPAGDGHNLLSLLLNSTWLRTGILTGSDSINCLDNWNADTRASGMELWVVEASSSWNWVGAPGWPAGMPGQNSFAHGFFTLPQLGQYAVTGVGMIGRWAFALGGSFGLIDHNSTQFDVAADYFTMLTYKLLMGTSVLAVTGDEISNALVYASCSLVGAGGDITGWDISQMVHPLAGKAHPTIEETWIHFGARNGTITLLAVNPSDTPIDLTLSNIATTPRIEWIFTAPGDDLGSTTPVLNGAESTPLRALADGILPPMIGRYVATGNDITLPPHSQAFFVLLAAAAPVCM